MVVVDRLDGPLEPGVLPHMPKPAEGAAVGGQGFFSSAPGALAGGFGSLEGVRDFPAGALHGSCPIDAQEHQRGSGCGGDEPQDEGDKNVHGLGSSVTGCPGHPPFFP